MNSKFKHILLAVFSLIILVATLFVYTKIENQAELRSAKLGYPAYFLEQNFTAKYEKYYFFPTWEKVDWSGKYPIVKFSAARAVVDFILIFIVCEGLIYLLETVDFAIRKEKNNVV